MKKKVVIVIAFYITVISLLAFSIISWWLFQRRDIRITGERSWLSLMRFRRGKSKRLEHSTT